MATAREEAERLVAAALAAASFAARSTRRAPDDRSGDRGSSFEDLAGLAGMAARLLGGRPAAGRDERPAAEPQTGSRHHIATGSAECCLCPVCRAIAAVRDPSPEFAERLASGASDLAAGVTSILRAVSEATRRGATPAGSEPVHRVVDVETPGSAPSASQPGYEAGYEAADVGDLEPDGEPEQSPWPEWSDFGSVWQAATRVQDDRPGPKAKPVAKKAVAKKAVAKKAVAKKAVAKKAAPPGATSGIGAAEPTEAATPSAKNSAAGLESPVAATPATTPSATVAGEAPAPAAAKKAAKKAAAKKTAAKKSAAKKTAQKSAGARTTPAKKASGPKKA